MGGWLTERREHSIPLVDLSKSNLSILVCVSAYVPTAPPTHPPTFPLVVAAAVPKCIVDLALRIIPIDLGIEP